MKALRIDALALSFVLVWASGYVVGALATRLMDPLAVTLWRFAGAAAVLALLALVRRERWPTGRALASLAAVGVPMFALQFGSLYTAMRDGLPAGTTALIACSAPLAVAALGAAMGWERLAPRQWVGVLLGVAGVAVTLSDRVGRPPSLSTLVWAALGLAGLVVGTALQPRIRHEGGPAATASVQVAAGAAVLAVWAPLGGTVELPLGSPHHGLAALGALGWLTLVTGVGSPLLLFALIRQRGATRATALLFPVPAVTALASWPILGTPIGSHTVAGLVIVAVALWLARRRTSGVGAAETSTPAGTIPAAARSRIRAAQDGA